MIRLLYPCDPFQKKCPDPEYAEEFEVAQALGLKCSVYSADDFICDRGLLLFNSYPALEVGDCVVYRGWMLSVEEYEALTQAIVAKGANSLTSITQYQLCHYLRDWYELCLEFTPETVFFDADADFYVELSSFNWSSFFVKDYVKSLTTSRGSVARTIDEVVEIVSMIRQYRGKIEGGICIRAFEQLQPNSEQRYFVFNKRVFAADGVIPEIVAEIARRINSPFFSVDVAYTLEGKLRLIELGDGQVSDKKHWNVDTFISIFKHMRE